MNKADYTIVIGRFQLFHNGHKSLIDEAIKAGERTIIVLGSATESRSMSDPFTAKERQEIIETVYPDKDLLFIKQPDSNFDNDDWCTYLKKQVYDICSKEDKITLVGHSKDHSSFYLRLFPEWEYQEVPSQHGGISATTVREKFFKTYDSWESMVPLSVKEWLYSNWIGSPEYRYILDWYCKVDMDYIIPWKNAPYEPTFVTADALVICNNHVLIITRGNHPGKGQKALPGGFIDKESLRNCAIRELKEETSIDISSKILHNSIKYRETFDFPGRDTRGRFITTCFVLDLDSKELPNVTAGDDAGKCEWIPIEELKNMDGVFYADHLRIIRYFLNIKLTD